MASTARPNEDVRILQAGTPASDDRRVRLPRAVGDHHAGPPLAPGGGQTDYQTAQYAKRLKAWQAKHAAEVRAEAAQTRDEGLGLADRAWDPAEDQQLGRSARRPGLAWPPRARVAASALAGLEEEAGNIFGRHRVIVLFCDDLSGGLPAGELTGVDVIVVTSYLPTAAAASAAQADLLGAGAAQAAVVGPEVTAAQLAGLVSADLSRGRGERFGLGAGAVRQRQLRARAGWRSGELKGLLPRLRKPGATAVINGFASTPGTAEANYILSYQRATAVARFLETNGHPDVLADHRGARGQRRGRFGGLGREPAGARGDRGVSRAAACRCGSRGDAEVGSRGLLPLVCLLVQRPRTSAR